MVVTELQPDPAVEAREVYRFYHAGDDETFALRGVSLAVRPGELVAVIGPSGSGKSTLLACLAGLDEPDGGHIVIGGHRLTRRPEPARAALRASLIGVLLQSGNLLEHLTVAQNVRAAQTLSRKPSRTRVGTVLGTVGLTERASAYPTELSGGETARAGLAVALANDPSVLLADEPTGEVDGENESRILDLLRVHTSRGAAVVVVSHSDRVASSADRVIGLVDGRIADG